MNFTFFIRWALKNGLLYRSYSFRNLSFYFPFNTKKTGSPSRYLTSFYVTVYYCNTKENRLKNSCSGSLQICLINKPKLYTKNITLTQNFKFLILNYILIYKYWILNKTQNCYYYYCYIIIIIIIIIINVISTENF